MGSELPLIAAGGMALVIVASVLAGWIARGKAERHTTLRLSIEEERVAQLRAKLKAFKAGGDLMVDVKHEEAEAMGDLSAGVDPDTILDRVLRSSARGGRHRVATGEAEEPDRLHNREEKELGT